MAARAAWKGQLRLSLVSIPVELYPATRRSAHISFRQIHEPSGKPVHYQSVVDGVGPIDKSDIVKGYEVEKGEYVLLDPEEIDAIKLETKRTLELVQFVSSDEIPPLYYDKPYYLVPTDELAEDAYRVVRDALRDSRKTGLGQLTLRGQEYLAAVRPCGDGLLLETLHYADEIRNADPMFSDITHREPDQDLLSVATELIDKKTAPFDASVFKDHYSVALRDLVKRKTGDRKAKRAETDDDEKPENRGDNVVDLMSALKKSLEGSGEDDNKQGGGKKTASGKGTRSGGTKKAASSSTKSSSGKSSSTKSSKAKSSSGSSKSAASGSRKKSA
ncbi:non-homologous end joining protein Ku [Pararhizobium mangrovi]|uniref:Non-homologous end joining protein Ku n=1 Tax=Pararhizobium mangrovi TaxID=2590452 RepID=A0A506U0N3_9HYPH|nr:Ku protein [Pararhizobium mangrovi]TPW27038.1 Ku protein [Pararhizobium mangrovi]